MSKDTVTPYFINKAVFAYNLQFNTNFDPTNSSGVFKLIKIPTEVNTDYHVAYEVDYMDPSLNPPSHLRLRNYLSTYGSDSLGSYQQQSDDNIEEVSAGAFVTGTEYTVVVLGSTDFTTIGATAPVDVGTVFTATGPGTGNGVASYSIPAGQLGDEVMVAYGGISQSTINSLNLNVLAWMGLGSETVSAPTGTVTSIPGGFQLTGDAFASTRPDSTFAAMSVSYTLPGGLVTQHASTSLNFTTTGILPGATVLVSFYYTSNHGVNSEVSPLYTVTAQ